MVNGSNAGTVDLLESVEEAFSVDEINHLVEANQVAENRAPYGSKGKGYRDLRVYQESLAFVADIYRMTQEFPKSEQFGMTSQIRRAAVSILINIAEGWGRHGKNEFARFIDISSGSLCEVESLVEVATVLGYIAEEQRFNSAERTRVIGAMLHKLRVHLRSQ